MFERERREARERAAQPVDRPRAPVRRRSVVLASPEAEAPKFATGSLPSPPITRIRRRGATSAEAGAEVGADGGEISADTSRSIEQARGGGRPLDGDVRHQMEAGFGADFSAVRVHSDARAAALNERVQADAFTIGSDIFLRQPVLDTSSPGGQHLLAHELAHTI